MGFRSYIRQFLGAILMLFRPSLPWGFAVVRFLALEPATGVAGGAAAAAAAGNRRKKVAKIIFFYGFQKQAQQQQ